jgi:hypothetical protein
MICKQQFQNMQQRCQKGPLWRSLPMKEDRGTHILAPPPVFCAAFSACHWRIWLSCMWHTITIAGTSSGIRLHVKEMIICLDCSFVRAFPRAKGFQSSWSGMTSNSAKY